MGVPRGKAFGIRPAPNHGIGITVVGDMENANAFALFPYYVDFLVFLVDWCSRRPSYPIFVDYGGSLFDRIYLVAVDYMLGIGVHAALLLHF